MNEVQKPARIFKIDLNFLNSFADTGKDPLALLLSITSLGDVIETNTNISTLPALPELNTKEFYLSWTFVLKAKATSADIKSIFHDYKDIGRILIEEYDEDYLTYASDALIGNKIGEVLVEKGLINQDEIKTALREQKKLGQILIDAGLITEEQLAGALDSQKKIGQILIESGKIHPTKILSLIEQQKQVRTYREQNTLKIEMHKLDKICSLLNKLLTINKTVNDLLRNSEVEYPEELIRQIKLSDEVITEIRKSVDNCRNAT